jgi:hypothetical protein
MRVAVRSGDTYYPKIRKKSERVERERKDWNEQRANCRKV